jgi:beta-lactamase superfamily II metal-dependent hydrolase
MMAVRRRWSWLSLFLAAVVLPTVGLGQLLGPRSSSPATVEFLDVGQGDSILIQSPEGRTALIDAGPSKDVVKLLHERGLKSIDLVVVTHHHSDHYGGMEAVVREFHPRYFIATNSRHTTPQYLKLLQRVRDDGITFVQPTGKMRRIELGSVTMTMFPQPPEDTHEENNNSIGLRVEHGALAVLLTGDSEYDERAWWLEHCPELVKNCQLLKLAHHGSRNGTDATWLEAVRPRAAIASLATGNDYGHPHKETVDLVRKASIPLLQTNLDGTITATSDGKVWKVTRSKTSTRAPPTGNQVARETRHSGRPSWTTTGPSHRIDLNHASQDELESLPGVGPTTARRIIENRPYRSVEELREVRGIGATRYAEIAPQVTVR